MRPEVGTPLQAAQDLIKAQKYKEALAKVRDAEAVPNKTAHETYLIERMRIAAASGAGDMATAAKAYEALSGSGKVSAADKLRMVESIAGGYYRAKDYAEGRRVGAALRARRRHQRADADAADPGPVPLGRHRGRDEGADGRDPGRREGRQGARRKTA